MCGSNCLLLKPPFLRGITANSYIKKQLSSLCGLEKNHLKKEKRKKEREQEQEQQDTRKNDQVLKIVVL